MNHHEWHSMDRENMWYCSRCGGAAVRVDKPPSDYGVIVFDGGTRHAYLKCDDYAVWKVMNL